MSLSVTKILPPVHCNDAPDCCTFSQDGVAPTLSQPRAPRSGECLMRKSLVPIPEPRSKSMKVTKWVSFALVTIAVGVALTANVIGDSNLPNQQPFPDPTGVLTTYSTTGALDLSNPFFQSVGTNGRSCGSCHQPSDAMTVTAVHVQTRFDQSQGLDPIFRTNDGSNCDHNIDASTLAGRSAAYSLLRFRGLIRVALT